MLPFLLATVDSADESVRKIVAECLGVLVVSHSNEVAPLLVSLWQDSLRDAKFRSLWTAITSYRCCMSSHQSRSDIVDILAIAPLIQSCDDLEVC